MPQPFALKDFASLALALRQTVAHHKVPPDLQASLIEDVVFQFAVLIDEKTGSDFHESIDAVLSRHAKQLGSLPKPADFLVAEVEITFHKGRKAEFNVLRSGLAKPAALRLILEVALGVRDIAEVKARVDTGRRFAALIEKKRGVKALRFNSAETIDKPSWQEVQFRGEQSIEGLIAGIRAVVTQWL